MKIKLLLVLLTISLLTASAALELTREPEYVMTACRTLDADGRALHEETYDTDGNILTDGSTKYVYENGRLVREEEHAASTDDSFALLRSLIEYDYDLFGRLVEQRKYNKMEAVLDESGTLVGVEPVLTSVWRYEHDGDTVTTTVYEADGETVQERVVETYDREGRKLSMYDYYPADTLYRVHKWEYGENFTNEEHYRYDSREDVLELSYREKHTYDEQGRELSVEYFDGFYGEQPCVHSYDDAGNLVETVYCDLGGEPWRAEYYEYADGRLVRYSQSFFGMPTQLNPNAIIDWAGDPRNLYSSGCDYTYNEDGLLIEEKVVGRYGNMEATTTYTYDEFGNCIREEKRSSDGELLNVIEREFTRVRASN